MLLASSVAMLCMENEMDLKEEISYTESPPTLLQYAYNTGQDPCSYCHSIILDQTVPLLEGHPYHSQCLRCSFCVAPLASEPTCFIKDGLIVCKQCYRMKFRRSCEKCGQLLTPDDVVMRARDSIFHVHCFCCCVCRMKLNAGEFFVMSERGDIYCHLHSEHQQISTIEDTTKIRENSEENEEYTEEEPCANGRSKRMRTSFKHHQLKAMKVYFSLNHNPDAKDLKQLAQKTGLTKRVLQVWFQNARAKYRRSMQGREGHSLSPTIRPPPVISHVIEAHSSSSTHSSDYLSTSPIDYESQ